MIKMTKLTLCMIVVFAVVAGAAYAGCGVKDTHEGTLKSFDEEKNVIVVAVAGEDGEQVTITLTADTTVKDGEGNDTKPSNLVGTKVKVVSEHAKADSVEQMA